jgi:hypothetical protein
VGRTEGPLRARRTLYEDPKMTRSHCRFFAVLLMAAVLWAALGACASRKTDLPGAVYANQVPLYPAAAYEDAMGGTTYGDGVADSESLSWFFEVKDSPEKVLAYYDEKLSDARKVLEEDGTTSYTISPQGAEEGEVLVIRVRAGRLQITEETKAGKHKD